MGSTSARAAFDLHMNQLAGCEGVGPETRDADPPGLGQSNRIGYEHQGLVLCPGREKVSPALRKLYALRPKPEDVIRAGASGPMTWSRIHFGAA
jgi:hypothetical protein